VTLQPLAKMLNFLQTGLAFFENIDLNSNNAKIKIKNSKLKVVNIARIKPYMEEPTIRLSQDTPCSSESNNHLSQEYTCLSKDDLQGLP
jgi:hypothetical protein